MRTRHASLLALLLAAGACGRETTACDGFADRKLAITAGEYRGCAREILDALDAIEPPLRTIVAGRAVADGAMPLVARTRG